jgi:hypothetical protein
VPHTADEKFSSILSEFEAAPPTWVSNLKVACAMGRWHFARALRSRQSHLTCEFKLLKEARGRFRTVYFALDKAKLQAIVLCFPAASRGIKPRYGRQLLRRIFRPETESPVLVIWLASRTSNRDWHSTLKHVKNSACAAILLSCVCLHLRAVL